ncbi:deoxyribose-phosphate aldolase [Halovivax limisalsi]|uniref:deoxyribose-phosphate aldolase n=1 Tax=Halovivax limisalsi TaxID=1453760 RepID=UPI001FFDD4C9|nr:deoxyribose-phosphate aldolase [Halovivax limisalsi]
MDRAELAPSIDHTVLGPGTTERAAMDGCAEADRYGANACIPPCYLEAVRGANPDLTIATVVGFPHGQHAPAVKCEEAVRAWRAGADELDVVCNVGRLRAGETDAVREELAEIVAAVPIPVKVIVEAPLLSDAELDRACEAAVAADAAMVKTSTGFVDGGATVEDVGRMAEHLPVKASGGIGTYDEAMAMIDAGADRIGTSSGVAILEGAPDPANG